MIDAKDTRTALEYLWAEMVVLAEEGNDIVVDEQRDSGVTAARHIARIASDLATLSRAAEVLARLRIA